MKKKPLASLQVQEATPAAISAAQRLSESPIEYIALGRLVTVEHNKMLLLHFYPRLQLEAGNTAATFRTFIGYDDYITQRLDCQPTKWPTGAMETIIQTTYDFRPDFCWLTWEEKTYLADEETVVAIQSFCGTELKPLAALRSHQAKIQRMRLEAKHQAIAAKIDEKMALVPEMPADFSEWLHDTAFATKRYIFYRYQKGKKMLQGRCVACRADVEVESPRHLKEGVCPACGKEITFLASGKATDVREKVTTQIIQPVPEGFVVRSFEVWRKVKPFDEPKYFATEVFRDFFEGDMTEAYNFGKFLSTDQRRWCFNKSGYCFNSSALYERNLPAALAGTQFSHCAIERLATHQEGFQFCIYWYLRRYSESPLLEYLVKLRLYNIACAFMEHVNADDLNKEGRSAEAVLGITKPWIAVMQLVNGSIRDLRLAKELARHMPANDDIIPYIRKTFAYDPVAVARLSQYVSLPKLEQYLWQQPAFTEEEFNQQFIWWRDYIDACKKLGYDLTNDFVLFPRDLKKTHDITTKRARSLAQKERMKILGERSKGMTDFFEELQRAYGFEHDGLAVIAPRGLQEVVTEGHKLRHCVDQYVERFEEGRTVILFLRRTTAPKTPFYTMEVKDGKIQQCRGKCNCAKTDAVQSFIEAYEKNVLKKARKAAA